MEFGRSLTPNSIYGLNGRKEVMNVSIAQHNATVRMSQLYGTTEQIEHEVFIRAKLINLKMQFFTAIILQNSENTQYKTIQKLSLLQVEMSGSLKGNHKDQTRLLSL